MITAAPPLPASRSAVHPALALLIFAISIASYYVPAPNWAFIFGLTLVTYIGLPWLVLWLSKVPLAVVFRRGELPLRPSLLLLGVSLVVIPTYLATVLVLADAFPAVRRAIRGDIRSVLSAVSIAPIWAVAAAGLLFAFAEEFFFRAFLQSALQRWGKVVGLLAATLCFAVAHHSVGKMVPMILMGLWFGYVYWRSGSVWLATLAHFLVNASSFAAVLYLARAAEGQRIVLPQIPPAVLFVCIPAITLIIFAIEWLLRRSKN